MKNFTLLLTLVIISCFSSTFSQVTIPSSNTNSGSVNDPLGTWYGFERSAMIYSATEIGTTGTIIKVGFYVNSASSPGGSTNVRIYMKTRTSTMTSSTTYASEISGATLVYGPTTISAASFATSSWTTITLATPFNYTGNNLEVIVETNATGTGNEGSAGKAFRYATQSNSDNYQYWNDDNSAPTTTGTRSNARPNIRLDISSQPSLTLSNYSASATLSTSFAHRIGATNKPKFTVNATASFNQIQFELNTKSDFTGTAITSTINNSVVYPASTLKDFFTTTALPSGDRTYFVRARASNNGGTNYGPWTTTLWPYSYFASTAYVDEGWYFTSKEQFTLGTVQESGYNFTQINDNATLNNADDDNIEVIEGTFTIPINNGVDDGGLENGWYGTSTYINFGFIDNSCASTDIVNLFRFINIQIPQASVINSAILKVYSATSVGSCPNSSAPLSVSLKALLADNAAAPSNTIASSAVTSFTTASSTPWVLNSTAWANNVQQALPEGKNVIQEIVNRSGWTPGNSILLRMKWDASGGVTKTAQHYRFIRMYENGASTAPSLDLKFTNFYNTINFPNVNRAIYGPLATAWNKLKVTDDLTSCGSCYVEYRIHNASTNAVVAGPFTRSAGMSGDASFDISSVGVQNVYVSTRIFRNSSPIVHNIWLTTNTPSPLPVEMGTVNMTCTENGTEIQWTTLSENNASHFEVFRSQTGEDWEFISTLNAQGNTSQTTDYQTIDQETKRGASYYKLIQYDFNGNFKEYGPYYSRCEAGKDDILIYPNPANESIIIEYSSDKITGIQLIDLAGKIILEPLHSPKNKIVQLDVSKIQSGVYFIVVSSENEKISKKMIIQH